MRNYGTSIEPWRKRVRQIRGSDSVIMRSMSHEVYDDGMLTSSDFELNTERR